MIALVISIILIIVTTIIGFKIRCSIKRRALKKSKYETEKMSNEIRKARVEKEWTKMFGKQTDSTKSNSTDQKVEYRNKV